MTGKVRLGARLGVSDHVVQDALDLYRRLQDADLSGHHGRTVPIAVIYIAIRQRGSPRHIEEVAAAAGVSPPALYRTAREIGEVLAEEIPPMDPELYVGRLVDEAGLGTRLEREALRLLSAARSADVCLSGRNPVGVAAGAVYTAVRATDECDVTQRDLGRIANVAPPTVRRTHHDLRYLARES